MAEGRVDEARGYFKQILKYDPRNAKAHLALATTFEADALDGNTQKRDLAEVGYRQALVFDERNWLAAYRLGVLELEGGKYSASIDHLARAAVLNRSEPAILGELARALYMREKFPAAMAVVERALQATPDDADLLRTAAMIAGAAGDSAQALRWSTRFRTVSSDAGSSTELGRRLDDWRLEYSRAARVTAFAARPDTAASPVAPDGSSGMTPASRSPFLIPGGTEAKSTMLLPLPALAAGARARMVQIDLTLIRTQEIETDTRGVNLLAGLRANFGRSDERTITRGEAADGTHTQTMSGSVLRTLKIPEVLYSLDIANTGYDRSDVLARPLLVALDGQPANYFVGEELSIPVSVSNLGPGTLVDKSIGTEIAVTPTFLDDNTVLLSVSASRSFVATNFQPGANTPVRQTIQRVTTAVVVDFDQTVILSGLSEHEARVIKSGVPILGEIPLLQYLFSTKTSQLFETSVLMVLTPRHVGETRPAAGGDAGTIETAGLRQLWQYFPELDNRITILEQVTRTLQHNGFRSLLSQEDVVARHRQSRESFWRRIAKQLRETAVY